MSGLATFPTVTNKEGSSGGGQRKELIMQHKLTVGRGKVNTFAQV
jgi:hypothetical protein